MITVGKRTYFPNAPWILNQQGTITPQALNVAPWVPANAVAYAISCPLFRTWADPTGYIDVATVIRLPGYTNDDHMVMAEEVETGRAAQANCHEAGGYGQIILPVLALPSGGHGFYWLIRGSQSCLNVGVNVSMALHWYETL